MRTHQFSIQGMTCSHCIRSVKAALEGVPGVKNAYVEIGRATVNTEDEVSRDELVGAIEAEDYRVSG